MASGIPDKEKAAGGMAFLIRELSNGGLLNEDVTNILGTGMDAYRCAPVLENTEEVAWTMPVIRSFREDVLAPFHRPFTPEGGLRCLSGNLGQSVIKVSAVAEEHHFIKAPCTIFIVRIH
jgi:phosphogluconate dehydratase